MSDLNLHDGSALVPDVYATATRGARRFMVYLALVIGLFLGVFVFWASEAEMDEITRGDGRVIPSGQNKVVQHLEGGIVNAILVREGQQVEQGQVLLRVDSTPSESRREELTLELYGLQAQVARLGAEADGRDEINFPAEVRENAPEIVRREQRLFQQRAEQRVSEMAAIDEQINQRAQQLAEARSSVQRLETTVALLREQLTSDREDYERGALSESDLERTQRDMREAEGELRTARLTVGRQVEALNEARQTKIETRNTFLAEARSELVEKRGEIETLRPQLEAMEDQVQRTDIRAPIRGTVTQVSVSTIGAVIRPGQALVEIVPLEDRLLVEARIQPQDRAFLRPNQEATVKITAYDYSIYGGLEGRVVDISADAIEDEQERDSTYYRIRIRTDRNYLERGGQRLPIIPGMTVSVDIQTGRKTVLAYLTDPISRVINESLRER